MLLQENADLNDTILHAGHFELSRGKSDVSREN